jgi:hypothetical protein
MYSTRQKVTVYTENNVKDKRTSTSSPVPPAAIIYVYQSLF